MATVIVAGRAVDFLLWILFSSVDARADIDFWLRAQTLLLDARLVLVYFLAFAVFAFMLKQRVFLPGILSFLALLGWNFAWAVHSLSASGLATSKTEVFVEALPVWGAAFIASFLGLIIGERLAKRRSAAKNAI